MSEPAPAPPEEQPSGLRVPRWLAGLVAVAVAGLVAAVVVLAAVVGDEDGAGESERRDVAAVASEVATRVFSFDHRDLDRDRARLTELLTGRMEAEYLAAFDGPLRQQLQASQSVGEATVKELFVGDVGAESAAVIAVLDLRVETADDTRTTVDSYVLLRLVRTREGWRVDDVVTVNGGLAPGDVLGTPTTSTTPPDGGAAVEQPD